jgi:GNAT superfamily N-acetyltransferase
LQSSSTTAVTVRPITPDDGAKLLELIHGLAAYEKLVPPDEAGDARFLEHLAEGKRFDGFIAEVEGEPVGYTIFFEIYSTFSVRPKLYMEDLFVRPECRSTGAGFALVQKLAEVAIGRNCSGMEWECLDWNQLAINFYERIGGEHDTRWLRYNLPEDAMRALTGG